jgi:hypothetical protein
MANNQLELCSFCNKEDDGSDLFLTNDAKSACICQSCAKLFTRFIMKTTKMLPENLTQSNDKNLLFHDYLLALEDKWMEKNIVNSYILGCGGVLNEVHFRFEDEDDGYYLVCELKVEGIDSVPENVEEKILNKIEWAFDDIRDELAEQGLDLDLSLGEKLVLTRVDSGDLVGNLSGGAEMNDLSSNAELNELCDAISDKLMETGYLTSAIEEGDLATVSINLEGDKNSFRININVQVDDRDSDVLSDDEEEAICDGLQFFIQEKQLESSFTDLGFDLDENCDGYSAYLVG